jgi:hypothetical protein
VRPQLCEINHSSAIWLHSFVFLHVFSIRRQGLNLLGEVDRATLVDNQRGRGAAIAGFRTELFGSWIELCRDSTKSRVIRTFRKIGNPSTHQLVSKLSGEKETVCYNCGRVLSCVCFLLLLLSIILISPFCYHI